MEKQENKKTFTWDYRMKLFKDTTVPRILISVFFYIVLAILLFLTLLEIIDGDLSGEVFLELAAMFGLIFIGLVLLTLVSYYVVFMAIHKGSYDIVYQMDEKGVSFITAKRSMDKVKKTALIGALAGIAAGSLSTVGSNLIAGSRSGMYTKFSAVTRVEVQGRKKKLILTESHVAKNHIYATEENFEQVKQHILERCKKAKVVLKGQANAG